MATLYWQNNSNEMVKWIVVTNGSIQGNALDPGQSYSQDDANVTYAGWSLSGFTGYTTAVMPPPAGYAGYFNALDSNADLRSLKGPGK